MKQRNRKPPLPALLKSVLLLASALLLAVPATAQYQRRPPRREPPAEAMRLAEPPPEAGSWARMRVLPGDGEPQRPLPPRAGRRACINANGIAAAQLFGDAGIELTMRDGGMYRMFFATECPGLSFYQGFYYRRGKGGTLCAGRDVVGARSGGECPIASIVPVPKGER